MIVSRMTGPKRLGPYPDRDLDCQEAMECGLLALVDQAEATGWLRTEAYAALIALIDNHELGDEARDQVFKAIDTLR